MPALGGHRDGSGGTEARLGPAQQVARLCHASRRPAADTAPRRTVLTYETEDREPKMRASMLKPSGLRAWRRLFADRRGATGAISSCAGTIEQCAFAPAGSCGALPGAKGESKFPELAGAADYRSKDVRDTEYLQMVTWLRRTCTLLTRPTNIE